jgi:hypothetical protein
MYLYQPHTLTLAHTTAHPTSIIKTLKTKNLCGFDEISTNLLKTSANYRPVSLLTTFSKVLEKDLYSRLIGHFDTHQLLVDNQYGFRKGIATEDAIYKLLNEILNASNNKTVAGSIFCDLEKAFVSVNHDILISK